VALLPLCAVVPPPLAAGALRLTVLDVGGQEPVAGAASIQGRIDRWRSWAERSNRTPGHVAFASLSDLPALIAGAGRLPVGGSVLKAA
jgi:hypothetical protein